MRAKSRAKQLLYTAISYMTIPYTAASLYGSFQEDSTSIYVHKGLLAFRSLFFLDRF